MSKGRILVVDDSNTFRQLMSMQLRSAGYEVINGANGAEAVKLALQERPDLIVLDVQMPVMDGGQALATLKARDETKNIPVLIVTTIGREEDERIIRVGGADGFLSKPINKRQVMEQVQRLLPPT